MQSGILTVVMPLVLGNGITANSAAALADLLNRHKNLKVLNLEGNYLHGELCDVLADAVCNHTNLEQVVFARNPIGKNFLAKLCGNTSELTKVPGTPRRSRLRSISINRHLVTLDLTGLGLEERSQDIIVQILYVHPALQKLHLGQNKIGPMKLELINALAEHHNLKFLDLSGNNQNRDDGRSVAAMILKSKLEELNLDTNDFGPVAGLHIAHSVRSSLTLKNLSITDNHLGTFHVRWRRHSRDLCLDTRARPEDLQSAVRNWTGLLDLSGSAPQPAPTLASVNQMKDWLSSGKYEELYEKLQSSRQARDQLERELTRTTVLAVALKDQGDQGKESLLHELFDQPKDDHFQLKSEPNYRKLWLTAADLNNFNPAKLKAIMQRLREFSAPTDEHIISEWSQSNKDDLMWHAMKVLNAGIAIRHIHEEKADIRAFQEGRMLRHLAEQFASCLDNRTSILLRLTKIRDQCSNASKHFNRLPTDGYIFALNAAIGDEQFWNEQEHDKAAQLYPAEHVREISNSSLRRLAENMGIDLSDTKKGKDLAGVIEQRWPEYAKKMDFIAKKSKHELQTLVFSLGNGLLTPGFIYPLNRDKLIDLATAGIWGGPKAMLCTTPIELVEPVTPDEEQTILKDVSERLGIVDRRVVDHGVDEHHHLNMRLLVKKWRLAEVRLEANQIMILADPETYLTSMTKLCQELITTKLKPPTSEKRDNKPNKFMSGLGGRGSRRGRSTTPGHRSQVNASVTFDSSSGSQVDSRGPSEGDRSEVVGRHRSDTSWAQYYPALIVHQISDATNNQAAPSSSSEELNRILDKIVVDELTICDLEAFLVKMFEVVRASSLTIKTTPSPELYRDLLSLRAERDGLMLTLTNSNNVLGLFKDDVLERRLELTHHQIHSAQPPKLRGLLIDQLRYDISRVAIDELSWQKLSNLSAKQLLDKPILDSFLNSKCKVTLDPSFDPKAQPETDAARKKALQAKLSVTAS
eukprot:c11650_g1_i1.p1 GENE.c11650_g1_i1~~c11650_g1_i1.p1  ORF type:complete len:978 (-),score=167.63 c11650_g1_i1:64-2997(-)